MAKKDNSKEKKKFVNIHRFMAAISILSFFVVVVAGIRAGVSISTITLRAAIVLLVIAVLTRIIIQVIETYEEMNSG